MNLGKLSITIGVLALVCFGGLEVHAQSPDRIRQTWSGPDSTMIMTLLKTRKARPAKGAAPSRNATLTFRPAGDSGVPKSLADAFGRTAEEKTALTDAFQQIKQGYDTEVTKVGKANNLAAAMTFFISANVATYHRTDMPSDEVADNLFSALEETMATVPAIARLSNLEKQQMHDWLVCMAGFVMAGYADAKQTGDQTSLNNFREFADYSMRLVLGTEVSRVSFAGSSLSIEGATAATEAAATSAPSSTENKIVGTWSKSASSPMGLAGTQNLVTNAGYYKGQYEFKPDGTYSFKAERWYGYMRAKEFYTTEESGTYSVAGDSLTVYPRASRTTQRNPEGVVHKSQSNQLEKVTYKWRLHYFEGLNETHLILQAAQETVRDGGFSGNSSFPNSFVYGPGGKEWRF